MKPSKAFIPFGLLIEFALLFIIIFGYITIENFNFVVILSVISFISYVALSIVFNNKVIDVFFFFIILTYIFHFGQIFLYSLNIPIILPAKFNVFTYNTMYTIASMYFSLILLTIMQITGFFLDLKKIKKSKSSNSIYSLDNTIDKEFFTIIMLLTAIPYFYVDISQIIISNEFGYVDAYKFGSSYLFSILSSFFIFSFMGFIITNRNFRINKLSILIFTIWNIYKMIMVGNRSLPMALILSLLFIYISVSGFRKIKFKVRYILFGSIIVFLLPYIAQIRNVSSSSFVNENFYNYILTDNPISYLLAEFGGTLLTLIMTVQNVPSVVSYSNGLTYIGSIAIFLPFSTLLFGDFFNQYISVGESMNIYFGGGLGGSWIAELYYNFGNFSVLFVPIITYFIKKLSLIIKNNNMPRLAINKVLIFFLLIPLFIYPRGYIYTFMTYINIYIYIFILNFLYKKLRKGPSKSELSTG
ncbi:MAG: hypothetical protein CVV56_06735 [Tenericutes bacterium HGW-Tenericutes-1]|jgi:hypothetical protein|nr:MAG: hypothetical protein CVV56_06735 [Tenericutes bacterium HGW-Tenericutes-1]